MSFQCYPDHRNIHSFPTRRSSDLANGIGYASFTFQVQDNGGIANGGVDLDQSANTMTVNVTSVNDAPAGKTSRANASTPDTSTSPTPAFGCTDPNDSPANSLLAVELTTLP